MFPSICHSAAFNNHDARRVRFLTKIRKMPPDEPTLESSTYLLGDFPFASALAIRRSASDAPGRSVLQSAGRALRRSVHSSRERHVLPLCHIERPGAARLDIERSGELAG